MERFRAKASKARQAQSRVKRLEKMDRIERDPRDTRDLAFSFKAPERSGRVVFELEDGKVEVPGRTLLEKASLWVERGEHVTLVGGNGSGKTTLIETLTGNHELSAGKLRTGHKVDVGYVSQHAEELTGGGNVLDAAQRATGLTPGKARALLGQFLFSGEDVMKPLDGLSGGELRRLSLAVLVSSGANMLVLDEPTNHLDVESREALEDALTGYPGSLLLVSHDRALLDAVGSRTFAIEDGTLRAYEGGCAEYVEAREARKEAERAPAEPKPAKKPRPARAQGAVEERGEGAARAGAARSRRPRPRCRRSRTSWPTPAPGRARSARRSRASATRARSASSTDSTSSWRKPKRIPLNAVRLVARQRPTTT